MMYLKSMINTALLATALLSTHVTAGLLTLETYESNTSTPDIIGGFAMTDFDVNNIGGSSNYTSSVASPISGAIEFQDRYGTTLDMRGDLADSTGWWINGESADYDIYTTGEHLIRILLPENTRAFSFNVGADLGSTGNNAWLEAEGYSQTSNDSGNLNRERFNVSRNNTLGFGIYADNSDGSCGVISSIVVDPEF